MGVLSKFAFVAAVHDAAAVQKGKRNNGYFGMGGALRPVGMGFLGLAAGTAASASATTGPYGALDGDALKMAHANALDDLSELLRDEDKMVTRYDQFMTQKYGPACGQTECGVLAYGANKDDPRFVAFTSNVALAHERNLKSGGRVVHGITSLMDMSLSQFKRLLGYKPDAGYLEGVKPEEVLKLKSTSPEVSVDWRDQGAVTPVKDQGQCGSCWAFSTVESMESAALVQGLFDSSDPFIGSPQELVSCDTNGDDQGCNGGLPSNGFKWFKNHKLEPEEDYPYTSGDTKRTGMCKKDESEGVLEVTKATATGLFGLGEDQDMKDWIMQSGPMSVAVAANSAWQTYQGGVMGLDECPNEDQPNHAVQAVALNTDAEQPYWVIRNSWAAGWGEEGFIRITYNENTCNVASDAYGVEVKKVDDASSSSTAATSSLRGQTSVVV